MDVNLVLQVVAAALLLSGQYLVNQRKVEGFYLWFLAHIAFTAFQLINGYWVFLALSVANMGLAIHGIYLWRALSRVKEGPEGSPGTGAIVRGDS